MAKTNFWKRLLGLWTGLFSSWLTDAERAHPEVAYQNAIESMAQRYGLLRGATARLVRRREELGERLERAQQDLLRNAGDLDTALDTQQDDLALLLVQRRHALEQEMTTLEGELQQAHTDAEEAKASLVSVKEELQKLQAEKDRMLARLQSAKARLQVQELLDGMSVDHEVRALESVRAHVKDTVAEARLGAELRGADLDRRLARLRASGANAAARAELERIKAERPSSAPSQVPPPLPRRLSAPGKA